MQTFNLDLSSKKIQPRLNAKQGEVGRTFLAVITDGSTEYEIPAGAKFSVWYSGAGGEGNYTDIGDRSAFNTEGNKVTVELITQMLNLPGKGELCLTMEIDGYNTSTWNIPYLVEAVPGMGSKEATQYFNIQKESAERAAASAKEAADSATAAQQAAEKLETDESLSLPGVAADAKATGERLATVEGKVADLAQEVLANSAKIGAVSIVCDAEGGVVTLKDAAELPLSGLKIFGKTTQDGTPTPDAPIELVSVGNGGSIGVTIAGKNLLDMNYYSDAVNDYGHVLTAKDFRAIKKGGVYTVSVELTATEDTEAYWNPNPKIFSYEAIAVKSGSKRYTKTFTALADGELFAVGTALITKAGTGDGVAITATKAMVECGAVATEYEDRAVQILTVPTPNGLPGIPVTSGGNYTDESGQQWICDEIDFARGVYVQRVLRWKATADTEIFSLSPIGVCNRIQFLNGDKIGIGGAPALCTHLPMRWTYDLDQPHFYADASLYLFLPVNCGATKEEVKAWLIENNLSVVYQLATPIEAPLSEEELAAYAALHTNKPNTTIYNDAGADMKASYVADPKIYIDNKFNELAAAIVNNT